MLGKLSLRKDVPHKYQHLHRSQSHAQIPQRNDNVDFVSGQSWHAATIDTLQGIFTSSSLNLLFVFVPIGLACHFVEVGAIPTFILNGLAIVPLSALLTDATERIAAHSGDTLGALLNITLGNLVELILL